MFFLFSIWVKLLHRRISILTSTYLLRFLLVLTLPCGFDLVSKEIANQ